MRIFALLPEEVAQCVRRAVPSSVRVEEHTAMTMTSALLRCTNGTVVMDLAILRLDACDRILDAVSRSGLRVIVYTSNESTSIERYVLATRMMHVELLLHGAVNENRLIGQLTSASERTPLSALFDAVRERLDAVSRPLRAQIVSLFGWCSLKNWAHGAARAAASSPRTLRRRFAEVGFCAPERFLQCIRLARELSISDPPALLPGTRRGATENGLVQSFRGLRKPRAVNRWRALDQEIALRRLIAMVITSNGAGGGMPRVAGIDRIASGVTEGASA